MNKLLKALFLIWFANDPKKATRFAANAFLYYVAFSIVVVVVCLIAWSE